MRFGGDYLGAPQFEDAILAAHKPGDAAGLLYRTFPKRGEPSAKKTVIKLDKSGLISEMVIHLAPFDGNHLYPISNLLTRILSDCSDLEKIQTIYPGTRLMLSPFCENGYTVRELAPVFKAMAKQAPSCLLVNSTITGTEVPGVITEVHIPNGRHLPRPPNGEHTISFDGFGGDGSSDFIHANIKAILMHYPNARHIRWWDFYCNGKKDWEDKTPIPARTHWPDAKYIRFRRGKMD